MMVKLFVELQVMLAHDNSKKDESNWMRGYKTFQNYTCSALITVTIYCGLVTMVYNQKYVY